MIFHAATKKLQRNAPRLMMAALLLLMPFVLPSTSAVQQIDGKLIGLRAELAPRNASDRFVFAAIDKESLDHVGTWPWPRSVHARIIDALVDAEAADVFMDIDFSTPSTPEEDRQLSASLTRAGGGVILPAFQQHQHVQDASVVTLTRPMELLAAQAWPALANVILDDAGRFRGFPTSVVSDGSVLPSVPVLLAEGKDPGAPVLSVDFSIHPHSVAAISVADILQGKLDAEIFKGRSVVVGAFATELKDVFPVPVYGTLSGPMLNILAAETLLQDRVPHALPVWPFGVLLALAILGGLALLRDQQVDVALAAAVAMIATVEIAAYVLQKGWSLQLPTVTYHVVLVAGLAILLVEKIGLAAWLLEVASAERSNTRRILKRVINDSKDPVIIVDDSGRIIDFSRSAANLFNTPHGLRRGDQLGQHLPVQLIELIDRLSAAITTDGNFLHTIQEEVTVIRNGQPLHLEAMVTMSRTENRARDRRDSPSFVSCITLRDVTARKAYEAKLRRLAQLDDLTGTLNRRELIARVEQSLSQGIRMVVAAIDLHRFATINATFGRAIGDRLLTAVARRLMTGARHLTYDPTHAFVARLGGDVFCIAVALEGKEDTATVPEAILALFQKALNASGIKIQLDVRIGTCLALHDLKAAGAVDAAELSLDKAKRIGGSGWHIYDPVAAVRQARQARLEQEMRSALRENQFFLAYQPQVAMDSGAVIGAEALMRWKHPELGLISPIDFIEVAESNGFICDLGRWALLEACAVASSWPSHLTIAVNVSAVQFAKADLCTDVRDALAASGLEPHRLHLEVTETAFLLDPERLLKQVTRLRLLGVRIALDDFGTGYSSLAYIARFPFDKIKIDQCFVRGIVDNSANQAIVRSVQSLASGLGILTVCEGVEGQAEWRILSELGCQQAQGYFFGRPQSPEEFLAQQCDSRFGRHTQK